MNIQIAVLLTVFTSMLLNGCASQKVKGNVATGSIIAYGLCVSQGEEDFYEHTESVTGYASTVDLSITTQTVTIPLKKDIAFGYSWQAENLPKNAEITYVISHPEITKPDGTILSSFNEKMILQSKNGKLQSTDCYTLSEDYEMVAGNWTIAIKYNGNPLVTKTFKVIQD